jgi:uncharacterized membrane protein
VRYKQLSYYSGGYIMNGQIFQSSQSKIGGLEAKYMILIAYFGAAVLGFVPGVKYVAWLIPLIIYLVDKENKFIAFHALQAFFLELAGFVISLILAIVTAVSLVGAATSAAFGNVLGIAGGGIAILVVGVIAVIISILILIFAILAAIHGYKYEIYEIKLVGKQASKIVFK